MTEEQMKQVKVNTGGTIIDQTGEDGEFIDSMHHVLDDDGNPLCRTNAKIYPAEGSDTIGQLEWRDSITGGEDNKNYACRNCCRIARSRFRKGWKPDLKNPRFTEWETRAKKVAST
ncbi:MAG: hypothetical protein ACXAC5_01520 [Promethearchaeota archaeon]